MAIGWEYLLFFGCGAGISIGCLVPANWLPPLPNDKALHFIGYGLLSLLAGRIARGPGELGLWLLGLFLAGWAIEYLQNWVPGRRFCWRDLLANTAGIAVAALGSRAVLGV